MTIKWKRFTPLATLTLWSGLSVIGWTQLQKRWSSESLTAKSVPDPEAQRTRVIETWDTGQSQARIYKTSQAALQLEMERTLAGDWRTERNARTPLLPEPAVDFSSMFLDVLLSKLQSRSEKGLALHWNDSLLRRWPRQKDEIELMSAYVELRAHRLERASQRLQGVQGLGQHPYMILIQAYQRAMLRQQERSYANFKHGNELFIEQSITRMRAGLPLDLWVENYENLLFDIAENYLAQGWWDEATVVLNSLNQQEAEHPQLSRLMESLRSRRPPGRAG